MFGFVIELFIFFVFEIGLIGLQVEIVKEKLKDDKDRIYILCIGVAVITLFSWYFMNNIISNIVNTNSSCTQIISLVATLILVVLARIIARAMINRELFYATDQQLYELSSMAQQIQLNLDDTEKQQKKVKKLIENNEELIDHYKESTKKAISSNNEIEARHFLEQKQQRERENAYLEKVYTLASEKLTQMQEMYTRLTDDISLLKTQRKIIEVISSTGKAQTGELTLDDAESNASRILLERRLLTIRFMQLSNNSASEKLIQLQEMHTHLTDDITY